MPTAAGDIITASDFAADVATLDTRVDLIEANWTSFTPTFRLGLNNLTLGNGQRNGYYKIVGKTYHLYCRLLFGSTSSWPVNDVLNLVLPFSVLEGSLPGLAINGVVRLENPATPARRVAFPEIGVANNCVAAMLEDGTVVDGTAPIAWANGSTLQFAISGCLF